VEVFGSKRLGIERSPRRRLRYRPAGRNVQTSAPELPRLVADPTGLGLEHHVHQAMRTEHGFEATYVLERSEAHGLRDDPVLRSRLRAHMLPPEKLLFQFGQKILRE